MLIHTAAGIPLKQESLGGALRKFTDYVRDSLLPGSDAEASITLNETGARSTAMLASSLPAETEEFGLGFIPSGKPLTAAQFRESVSLEKPKRTRAQVRLHGPTLVNLFPLLDRLAEVLPASGRGMMLLVHLTHWTMAGSTISAVVDATFSRFRHGTKAISGVIALRFSALSLKGSHRHENYCHGIGFTEVAFQQATGSFSRGSKS